MFGFFQNNSVGLVVEQGGVGAGTVIRFQMSVFGRKQVFRAAISEPGPALVETDLDTNGAVTTFTVNRGAAAGDCEVAISTQLSARRGFFGVIEKKLFTLLLRSMHVRELANLARVAIEAEVS